ncbi:DUF4168 domain-containing protein [Euhalothece natronophila Z-M001]|uniref:DUF4168 domain-containing protein n=1 Tax=Euhalothece natronophila Z-M001 TaxID=522448 RepID=A0A5B8NHK1_9CHRO|nr:DUF4168 domain-containing protein [Euhalothece natronophila]QDZ38703.1 DUF4168 domain-containing protein [Euhalothece natronophila Z-M001]
MLKSFPIISIILLLFLTFSPPALAQNPISIAQAPQAPKIEAATDISSQELEEFATAIQQLEAIQTESREQVGQIIEDEGLTAQQFRDILEAQRDPEIENEASEEELQQFENATEQLVQIQREAQVDMREAVEATGLKVERFQAIFAAVREQPELREQVQQIIQDQE